MADRLIPTAAKLSEATKALSEALREVRENPSPAAMRKVANRSATIGRLAMILHLDAAEMASRMIEPPRKTM